MRAFVVPEFGAPGAPGERPKPQPDEGQVLVRVHAAGINAVDNAIIAGSMKDFEYATAVAGALRRKPAAIDHATAAALPTAGAAALALVDAVAPQPGETILIVGAGGGVGSFAIGLVVHAGAHVVAVTRGDFAEHVRALGASDVIDYAAGADGVIAVVRARYPQGVDAIIDMHSDKDGLNRLADLVRPGGRLASPRGSADVEALAARGLTGTNAMAALDRIGNLAELVAQDKVRIPVRTYPLDAAAAAFADQASGHFPGKLVLVIE